MKLSIICLNITLPRYSTREKYHEVLTSLFANPPSCPFEVIMVDNGSTDGSLDFFRERWGDKITHYVPLEKNLGYQAGNNRGIAVSSGEYIVPLNPDITITEGVLDGMVAYMDTHGDVAIMGPKLIYENGVVQDSYRRFMKPLDAVIKRLSFLHGIPYFKKRMTEFLLWKVDNTKIQEIDWLVGAFSIIRRSMFETIGWYDERFFLFNGDTDICRSFWKQGWKVIYNPTLFAGHRESRLSGKGLLDFLTKKTGWIHIVDMFRYFLKWGIR